MVLWAPVKVQHMTHLNTPALTCTEDEIKANCPVVRKLDITWDHKHTNTHSSRSVHPPPSAWTPDDGFHPPQLWRFDPLILQPNFNLKPLPAEKDGQLLITAADVVAEPFVWQQEPHRFRTQRRSGKSSVINYGSSFCCVMLRMMETAAAASRLFCV